MKHLDHGKRYPWLLTLPQTYMLWGVVLAANVAILVALVLGASENEEALATIARAAELATPPEPPHIEPEPPRKDQPSTEPGGTAERTLRVSVPADWHWTGCRASESTGVEILFSPPR